MTYMLGTNVCIYAINKKPVYYIEKLESLRQKHTISISAIVLAELQYGVSNSNHIKQNQINLDNFLSMLEIKNYCGACAYYYGEIKSKLKQSGIIIGSNDLLIASHALKEQAILVTNNSSEFKRVEDLQVEIWEQL